MKHAAEQLVIGKAVTGENLGNAPVGVKNIAADVGKSYLIDKTQESDSHALLEEPAEIFRIQRHDSSGILQSDGFRIMRVYIVGHSDETGAFRLAETAAAVGFRKLIV